MLCNIKDTCNAPPILAPFSSKLREKKIQETYLFLLCVPGEVFHAEQQNKTWAALLSASRNANQRTFFFRQPSLEVSWFLAVRRGRGRQEGKHSESSGWSEVSKCFRNSRQWKHLLSPTQRQVKRQLSKWALGGEAAEAQSEEGGGRREGVWKPAIGELTKGICQWNFNGMWNQIIFKLKIDTVYTRI